VSYIICAEVRLDTEMNIGGDHEKVNASILHWDRGQYRLTFDIPGIWGKQQELTKKLCSDLIDAGFVEFEIRHSY
jgi:hypothetical protein